MKWLKAIYLIWATAMLGMLTVFFFIVVDWIFQARVIW